MVFIILACAHHAQGGGIPRWTCRDRQRLKNDFFKARGYCLRDIHVCDCFEDCKDGSDETELHAKCETKWRREGKSKISP